MQLLNKEVQRNGGRIITRFYYADEIFTLNTWICLTKSNSKSKIQWIKYVYD